MAAAVKRVTIALAELRTASIEDDDDDARIADRVTSVNLAGVRQQLAEDRQSNITTITAATLALQETAPAATSVSLSGGITGNAPSGCVVREKDCFSFL